MLPFIQQNYQDCNHVADINRGCRRNVLFPTLPVAGLLSDPTCCLLQVSAEQCLVTGSMPACSEIIFLLILICLLTAVGLTPGGSSTVHIYTQTIHRPA